MSRPILPEVALANLTCGRPRITLGRSIELRRGDDMVAEPAPAVAAGPSAGPLETRHLQSWKYRNAANTARLTSTHWHIAWANGLGWGVSSSASTARLGGSALRSPVF